MLLLYTGFADICVIIKGQKEIICYFFSIRISFFENISDNSNYSSVSVVFCCIVKEVVYFIVHIADMLFDAAENLVLFNFVCIPNTLSEVFVYKFLIFYCSKRAAVIHNS